MLLSGFWLAFSFFLLRQSAAKFPLEIQLTTPLLQTAYTVHIIKRVNCTKKSISYNYDQQICKNKAAYLSKVTCSFGNFSFPRKLELFHPLQIIRHAQIELPLNNLSYLTIVFHNFLGNNTTAIFLLSLPVTLVQLHDWVMNHIRELIQIKNHFKNLIFNLDHFPDLFIVQLSKNFTRTTEGDKCQCGNKLPGLLTLPVLFIHAPET